MFSHWNGQVALVSGAGSEQGIGFAIAKRLGDAGAKLIITGSSARIHERVAELISLSSSRSQHSLSGLSRCGAGSTCS
jgi:3-oxoacyl-[acyl-carrier protein] reductase